MTELRPTPGLRATSGLRLLRAILCFVPALALLPGAEAHAQVAVRSKGGIVTIPTRPLAHYSIVASPELIIGQLSSGGVDAHCPAGQVVVGGWSRLMSNGRIIRSMPLADGSGYTGSAYNDYWLAPTKLTVFAICVDPPQGYEIVHQVQWSSAQGELRAVETACPASKVLLGGGADAGDQSVYLASSAPTPDGAAWGGFFRLEPIFPAVTGGINRSFSSHAICATFTAAAGRRMASSGPVTLGPGNVTILPLSCAPQRATSVGFYTRDSMVVQSTPVPNITNLAQVLSQPDGWNGPVTNYSNIAVPATVVASAQAICVDVQ